MLKESRSFRFKRFSVYHHESTMKVGTDSVLLGAWTDVNKAERILDVGTGSGVIALMVAQRSQGIVHGIDIDESSVRQAKQNASNSPWSHRISMYCQDIKSYQPEKDYDLIVSNPPFFQAGMPPPDPVRLRARHHLKLGHQKLIYHCQRLLTKKGRLSIILPDKEGNAIVHRATEAGFYLKRKLKFRAKRSCQVERLLLEFTSMKTITREEELIHYNEQGQWTEDYINLTKDFYLKL